jgi:hypothetical protein
MVGVFLWWFVTFWNSAPATLGEASFREAVRRHHTTASTRVITDASLGPAPVRVAVPPTPVTADTTAGVALTPPDPDPSKLEPVKDQAWWHKRITTAREAVARDRLLVAALESRVAALANDIASRDDPEQRAVHITARQQALAELDRLTLQVEDGVAAVAAIQDEARKAGVPPGWVRN